MFIIIEIQKAIDGTVAIVPPTTYATSDLADSAYHTALAAAAVSSVHTHTVVMLSSEGAYIKGETYRHW